MRMTHAYRVSDAGAAAQRVEVPVAELGGGEVLIDTRWSSLNYKDALALTGAGKVVRRAPLVIGTDAVGVVAESGDDRYRAGDPVVVTGFGLCEDHDGGLAGYTRVPGDWVVPLSGSDEALSLQEAAILGTAGLTSALAIHRLEVSGVTPASGPVAVTGASGGTGSLAVAMLAGLGYEVTAFTGKREAHDLLTRLGATEVLDRPPVSQTRPLESARWAGAVDCVGGPVLAWLTRTAARDGVIATFGNTAGIDLSTTVLPFILRGISLLGVNTGWFDDELRRRLWRRMATDLRPADLAAIGQTVPFDEVLPAAGRVLDGQVIGRIVVDIC